MEEGIGGNLSFFPEYLKKKKKKKELLYFGPSTRNHEKNVFTGKYKSQLLSSQGLHH